MTDEKPVRTPGPSAPSGALALTGAPAAPSVVVPAEAPARTPPTPTARKRRWWPTVVALWLLSLVGVWAFMASRAATLTYAHQQLQLTQAWTHARMRVLEAQTQLAASNFGRAGEALRDGQPGLSEARRRLEALGLTDVARRLAEAESQLAIGSTLVERQDPAATSQAAAVVRALDDARAAASGAFAPSADVAR